MGKHVVGRLLSSNVHFVVVERVHGKVVSRVGWVVIHGLVKMGGQESAMVLVRERGGGIDRHETVSRDGACLEDLAQFPARDFRSLRTGRIGRGHGKVRSGVGGVGMRPGRGACHAETSGGRRGEERV
jgi:hypothetical protein